ncbi:MAG: CAP domain-containing protein [Verrucomicrobium sp.]|nr:CAP domain-containing protein [Verrucomicrobium sp.]
MKARLPLFLLALLCLAPALRADDLDAFRADALKQINAFRQEQGKGAVKLDPTLNGTALDWAKHLTGVGQMVHRDRSSLRALLHENAWTSINENLFQSRPASAASTVVTAWKNSPVHRANLLQDNIDRIGLGTAVSGEGWFYAVFNGAGVAAKRGFSLGDKLGLGGEYTGP